MRLILVLYVLLVILCYESNNAYCCSFYDSDEFIGDDGDDK